MSEDMTGRVYEIFQAACELESPERERYLDQACAGDIAIRERINLLLAHDASEDSFLDTPGLAQVEQYDTQLEQLATPEHLGPYRILRTLGHGGMGVVYLAEQEQPRRVVALKVLRPGMATAEMLARFAHETRALARLQHPGIAQIFEAGTADSGAGLQPFFAMEFVEGMQLLEFANEEKLSTQRRLELLVDICEALHHAHQKGVIHRDLKPANILVDASGQPKILDFGVARVTDADVQAATMHTTFGELIGTLPYMSPEQASGDPDAIDIRSDVYSLGVVGYELLSGSLPHDVRKRLMHEAVRIIREDPPTAISSFRADLRGDVETILFKALEKERDRRYQSASELAQDIGRYLRDEPISARPPSAMYQLRKFARRNRTLVAGMSAAVFVLLIGIAGTTWQWVRADHALDAEAEARLLAEREADRVSVVRDFLINMVASASPREKGSDLRVVEVIDDASGTIATSFAKQPDLAALLHHTLGVLYRHLGLLEQSELQHREAVRLREQIYPQDHPAVLQSYHHLAILLYELGRLDDAEVLSQDILARQRAVYGEQHSETLDTMNNLALIWWQQGKLEDAASLMQETLDNNRQLHGEEHNGTRTARANLALILHQQGKLDEAEPHYRAVLASQERLLSPDHPSTLITLNNLAALLLMQGRPDDSEEMFETALERSARTLGPDHPDTLNLIRNLARISMDRQEFDEAADRLRDLLDRSDQAMPAGHWFTAQVRGDYGWCLCRLGRIDEGKILLRESAEGLAAVFGEEHARPSAVRQRLAECNEK